MLLRPTARILVALAGLLALGLAAACAAGAGPAPPSQTVVLVSIDGWRWDYLDALDAPNLERLAARGVRSEGLIPAFPSKTFPNHYTVVTGLYPGHHGIVSNVMDDAAIGERFTMSAETSRDPRWWGGEPLWVTARRHGLRSASMFWPGSEVPLEGGRPDEWQPYDGRVPNEERVARVLAWLDGPAATRPAFVTLYFSDVDSAGHEAGPLSAEVIEAAARIDAVVGQLVDGVDALGLRDEVTLVLVSDHGMSQLSHERQIVLDDYLDIATLDIVDLGPYLAASPRTGHDAGAIVAALAGRHPAMHAYLSRESPEHLHYRDHPRIPAILALADDGWTITTRARLRPASRPAGGAHGYDPAMRSMHGLLIAAGAPLKSGVVVERVEAVHLYELMCRLLGIPAAPNDGDPDATAGFWR